MQELCQCFICELYSLTDTVPFLNRRIILIELGGQFGCEGLVAEVTLLMKALILQTSIVIPIGCKVIILRLWHFVTEVPRKTDMNFSLWEFYTQLPTIDYAIYTEPVHLYLSIIWLIVVQCFLSQPRAGQISC